MTNDLSLVCGNIIITIISDIISRRLRDRKVIANVLGDNNDDELLDKLFNEPKELAEDSGDKYCLSAENTIVFPTKMNYYKNLNFAIFFQPMSASNQLKSLTFSSPSLRPYDLSAVFIMPDDPSKTPFFIVSLYCVMYCIFSQFIYENQLVKVQPEIFPT